MIFRSVFKSAAKSYDPLHLVAAGEGAPVEDDVPASVEVIFSSFQEQLEDIVVLGAGVFDFLRGDNPARSLSLSSTTAGRASASAAARVDLPVPGRPAMAMSIGFMGRR